MITTELGIIEQDRRLAATAESIMKYLSEQSEPVDARKLLSAISDQNGIPEDQVATALSRIADALVWDYSRGPVRFKLRPPEFA